MWYQMDSIAEGHDTFHLDLMFTIRIFTDVHVLTQWGAHVLRFHPYSNLQEGLGQVLNHRFPRILWRQGLVFFITEIEHANIYIYMLFFLACTTMKSGIINLNPCSTTLADLNINITYRHNWCKASKAVSMISQFLPGSNHCRNKVYKNVSFIVYYTTFFKTSFVVTKFV